MTLSRRIVAEGLGTAFLLAAVVGSGIMGQKLAGGNIAIALLANTLATGATLATLIFTFGPISGAHFNPAVTLADASQGGISWRDAPAYIAAQVLGAFIGVGAAHLMFGEVLIQVSQHARAGGGQLFSEFVATFGLLCVIWGCARLRSEAVPVAVGLYITGAYWFTASTSFANPAVTLARAFTDTFAGIPVRRCAGLCSSAAPRRFRHDCSFPLACTIASFRSERRCVSTCRFWPSIMTNAAAWMPGFLAERLLNAS
jgi:glycerol uptake facilitator-like aquaporin